jgi:hypothetical protein
MYSCGTLFSKYFRRYGPWKYKFGLQTEIGRPPSRSNDTDIDFYHQSVIYAVISVYFNCTLIHMYMDLAVFNFSKKITCFAFYLVLGTEFSTCHSTNLRRRWLDLFCNYYHIQCVCNHSTALVVIFLVVIFHFATFWHIQNCIVNLDTMPLKKHFLYLLKYFTPRFFFRKSNNMNDKNAKPPNPPCQNVNTSKKQVAKDNVFTTWTNYV